MRKVEDGVDDRLFRNAMGSFATGVTIITTQAAEEVHGMTANAFMSISLNPKLVAISIGENAKMLQHIQHAKKFAINILACDQKEESMYFAGQVKEEREITFPFYKGLPIIEDALAVITCDLHSEFIAGDHTVFIGQVTGIKLEEKNPLVFSQGKYRELKVLSE